jgi:Spy/CpxP family protein refolding chaperone
VKDRLLFRRSLLLALVAALFAGCEKDRGSESGAASATASASIAPAPPPLPSQSAPPETPAARPAPPPPASAEAPPKPAAPKITRRPGLVGELFGRARRLALTDEQRSAVDRLDQELWGPQQDEQLKTALKEFVELLIAGVNAGRIDTRKLAPWRAAIEKAAETRREREAAALGELHGVLEPAQRKRLVALTRKDHPTARPQRKAAKPAKPDPRRGAERSKRRLARVGALLGLDEAQKRRVDAVLARFDPEKSNQAHAAALAKRRQKLLEVFEQDDPDASQLDLGAGPRAMLEHRVAFLTALLGVIKANQRAKLARTIERPTAARWGGAIAGQKGPVADT